MSGRVHEWVRMREFSDSESEWWEREREREREEGREQRDTARDTARDTPVTQQI